MLLQHSQTHTFRITAFCFHSIERAATASGTFRNRVERDARGVERESASWRAGTSSEHRQHACASRRAFVRRPCGVVGVATRISYKHKRCASATPRLCLPTNTMPPVPVRLRFTSHLINAAHRAPLHQQQRAKCQNAAHAAPRRCTR